MNVLITGGAGFIGTHLYNQLKDKHHVTRIDIVPGDGVIYMDLSNPFGTDIDRLSKLVKESDVVYHLASSIGVENIEKNPNETLQKSNNMNNLLIPMFSFTRAKLIFASTSEVYGSKDSEMYESDNLSVTSPENSMRGGYAAQKIMGEFLTKSYCKHYSIVRFFNVVGPEQNPNVGFVLPRFIESAKNVEPLTIYGDGAQTRSYCDIRDAVNVLELLLTEMDNEILNIGADNVYSTSDLAKAVISNIMVEDEDGFVSRIEYLPARDSEIQYRVPNLDKMKTIYEPKYLMSDIINSII